MKRDEELESIIDRLKLELGQQKHEIEALKQSAHSLHTLAVISADWFWEQDADYRFVDYSIQPGAKTQAYRDGTIGKARWEFPGAVPLSMSWEAHRSLLDSRQPFCDFEYLWVPDDGAPRYLSASGVPVFDRKNQFLGYQGMTRDISANQHSEEAERKASELLDEIIDNIPLAFHLVSVQDGHRMIRWNKAAEALYGLTRKEAMGRTVYDLWPKAAADRMHAADLELVASGVMQDFPDRAAPTKNSDVIRAHLRKVPLKDDRGAVTHILITAEDITARKASETALRTSEVRFRTVVAALVEGVILRDADGKIVDCNGSAERLVGRTLAQMKGSTSVGSEWQILREDGSPMPVEERPSVAARHTGLPQDGVVARYRKRDGSDEQWGLINVQPLFGAGGSTPSGFVSTITDITKLKRSEMEIVRLNVELENRVQRRTAQLEVANKELESFSYSVAHDLRTPLNTIDGFCALLQKALPPESEGRVHHYLARICDSSRHMGELIDGLLALAQLSRARLNVKIVDMSAEAHKILKQCAENDVARKVQAKVAPGLLVQADGALLRQVLENLISNAWKFTAKKSHAEISIGKEMGEDQQPVYFVKDNGAGFDMAHADKLFGTFERLHSTEEFAGTGIGLATVKRIITRHGGRVWAQSAVGKGSTFYFTLGNHAGRAVASGHKRDDADASVQFPRPFHVLPNAPIPAGNVLGASTSSDHENLSFDEHYFRSIVDYSPIGMTLVGLDLRRIRVNSAFCRMLGYSEVEMLARTVHDISHPDDVDWDLQQRKRVLAGEIESYQWERRFIHKSGRIVWGYLTCSLVRDADRRPLHFIPQIQDMTERKQRQ